MKTCAILPAAGLGTRLGLSIPKLLAPITENSTVWSILRNKLINLVDHIQIVVSPSMQVIFQNALKQDISNGYVSLSIQPEPIGMGDAIFCGSAMWSKAESILVVWADQLHVSKETLVKTLKAQSNQVKTVTLPLARLENPYVEYIFDAHNKLIQVKQTREGDQCQSLGFSDVGTFALTVDTLTFEWNHYLALNHKGNQTQEINFLPFLPFLSSRQWTIQPINIEDPIEARGINTREDLNFFRSMYEGVHP